METDQKFEQIFKALEDKSIKPKQGIFYDGQVFDAYTFVSNLIRTAKKSISKQLALDLQKHNAQYPPVKIKEFKNAHDRFLIIDETTLYHFGASLKDLGKKWFAFSKMEIDALNVIANLKKVNINE